MHLLDIEDLKIHFKTQDGWVEAVDGISFHLDEGETLGLVGESGCGKTTTAYAITQLLPKNAYVKGGKIFFKGKELLKFIKSDGTIDLFNVHIRNLRWSDISIIFQGAMDAFNPVYKVGKQIEEAMLVHPKALLKLADKDIKADGRYKSKELKKIARKRVEELFQIVGIGKDRIDNYPHEYSGGMKQRALIAMALALNPSLVIADEPTTAVDVVTQYRILGEIKKIEKEYKMAMIIISHDISTVAEIADRMAVMYAGRLAEVAKTLDLFKDPKHPYTAGLINAIPTIEGDKESLIKRLKSIPGSPPPLIDPPKGCRFHTRCEYKKEGICDEVVPEATDVDIDHLVWCHKSKAEREGNEW